jgi:hypothetical protein
MIIMMVSLFTSTLRFLVFWFFGFFVFSSELFGRIFLILPLTGQHFVFNSISFIEPIESGNQRMNKAELQ